MERLLALRFRGYKNASGTSHIAAAPYWAPEVLRTVCTELRAAGNRGQLGDISRRSGLWLRLPRAWGNRHGEIRRLGAVDFGRSPCCGRISL